MGIEPMRHAGREVDESARFDFLQHFTDIDLAAALERHVDVIRAMGFASVPLCK